MSNDLNSCAFIGRLGADPETRYMPNGDAVCSFRIAVGWKSKDKEGAEWVSIVTFGKLAEICGQYLNKGSQVFVSGRFKTDEYEKDGSKRYSVKIVANQIQFLGKVSEEVSENVRGNGKARPQNNQSVANFDEMDSEIPF